MAWRHGSLVGRVVGAVALPLLVSTAAGGQGERPLLSVGRTAERPVIDGRLGDAPWRGAACAPLFCHYQSGQPMAANTQVRAVWDDVHLYLAFRCEEPRMEEVRARLADRDAPVWGEDCVEAFLQPAGSTVYYHFIVNPLGTLYDERGQDGSWNCEARVAAWRGEREWMCELEIPWQALGGPPVLGAVWTGNFTRARRPPGEELSCWAVTGGSFHHPQAFGVLRFVEAALAVTSLSLGNLLPGINTLTATLSMPPTLAGPITLSLGTLPAGRGLARMEVAGGGAEGTVTALYELLPDDLWEALEVSVTGADGEVVFRQPMVPGTPRAPRVADVKSVLGKLRGTGGTLAAPEASEAPVLRGMGERALAELDAALERAREEQRTVTAEEWRGLVTALAAFQERALRPVAWTAAGAAESAGGQATPPSLDIAMACNERESAALFLSAALFPEAAEVRLSASELMSVTSIEEGSGGQMLTRDKVALREAVPVPLRGGGSIADPLPEVPPSGIIHLDPKMPREIWVTVDSEGVAPGYYIGSITVAPLDPRTGVRPLTIPLRVRVWPLELPKEMPIAVFVCDYNRSGASPAHLADLIRHHTNVFNVNGLPSPGAEGHADCSQLGQRLAPVRGKGLIFQEVWFMRESGWRPEYARWVREVAQAMEDLGIPYEDWVLHIYDETMCDEFLECAKQIKALEPRIRIFTDYMGTMEQIQAFAPYVDYWCPYWGDLKKADGACLEAMRATGKPIWTYECGSQKTLPLGRYRALPWVAWKYDLDGVFFWCYPGSLWDETPLTDCNYGHIYEGARGEPVSSRRWEAWSDGLEDLLILRAYERRLQMDPAQRTPTDDALLAEADAVAALGGGEVAAMAALRSRIAHRLLELLGTPMASDFPRMSFPQWPVRIAGDGKGSWRMEAGGHADPSDLAMVLRAPTPESWTFAVNPLKVAKGDTVRFSVWARGRGALRMGVCEGFNFGGDPRGHRISDRTAELRDEWQQMTVEHQVQADPVEVFVGFDYGQTEAKAILSEAEVQVGGGK